MTDVPAASHGSRVPWHAVPSHVKDAVADLLGSPVVRAESRAGGFSPGSADVVVCADGRRAFVKTATSDVNAEVVPIHRSEASVAAVLPDAVPAPALIGAADGGDWIALAFEEVEGRHPALPWRRDDLDATLDALAATAAAPLGPEARAVIPLATEALSEIATAWASILAEPEPPVDTTSEAVAWVHGRAERWAENAPLLISAATAGDSLLHFDVRDDNVLIRPDGTAILVDWPWALRGAAWLDGLLLLVDVRAHDPAADVWGMIDRHPAFEGLSAEVAALQFAALAGFMIDRGRRADPPGLPTLRAFQRAHGTAACALVREQLG